jgi:hypothetical protein
VILHKNSPRYLAHVPTGRGRRCCGKIARKAAKARWDKKSWGNPRSVLVRAGLRGGDRMRPTTRRLFSVAVLIFIASVVGLVLALIFQWPAQLGGGSGNPNIMAGELVASGTVTSLPLGPWIALTVFALLARSRRWWGSIAVVVLCLLGALFIFGGLGEAFAPTTPYVPRVVLVAAGVVYGGLGLALLLSSIAELIDRVRARRQPSRVS